VPEMHDLLHAYYEELAIDEKTAFCLDLAAEEVFTNMVRHNPSDHEFLSMSIGTKNDEVHLQWVDADVPFFDPTSRPDVDVTRPMGEREPGGLGLHLVRSVVDRVAYSYDEGHMRVDIMKKLAAKSQD